MIAGLAAVLLAAGRSRRFGDGDKLLAPLDGKPLVLHAAAAIAALTPKWRIAVCATDEVAALLAAEGFEIVRPADAQVAQSRSLAAGVGRADAVGADAMLLCLGDMPFVTLEHLRALVERQHATGEPVIASSRVGVPSPPAIFARAAFDRLGSLQGDTGARTLLAGAPRVVAPPGELFDIDKPGDLEA